MIWSMSLPPAMDRGEHRIANMVGIALRIILIFGCDGMCAQESDGNIDAGFVFESQQGFQQTQFS